MSNLLRSNLVVATGTALSRLTGLLRVVVFGSVIGQTALADAYKIGNETPNIVYELLLGGVLSATLVPLFTSFVERDDEESTQRRHHRDARRARRADRRRRRSPRRSSSGCTRSTPAASVDADQFRAVGTLLTADLPVQIFFYGAGGARQRALNARRRFFAAAWSPILPNLIIIVDAAVAARPPARRAGRSTTCSTDDRLRWTLGLGATAGIAAMALVLIPAVHARPGCASGRGCSSATRPCGGC